MKSVETVPPAKLAFNISTRAADPADACRVVELVRASFRPADLELTIYGASGMEAFLRDDFATPAGLSRSRFRVAQQNGKVIGFIEMRVELQRVWLNYVVTDVVWRGLGVGRRLIADALRSWRVAPGTEWLLDVFAHNRPAFDWYARMGFAPYREIGMWAVDWSECAGLPAGISLTGWAQAEAAQRAFGFSSFNLMSGDRNYSVGRLGHAWFRVTDPGLLTDRLALVALKRIDSRRQLLFCGEEPASSAACPNRRLLSTSCRLRTRVPAGFAEFGGTD